MFFSIDCGELYRQNILSLYPSVNTNENISSIPRELQWEKKE
jgi:hypothetical protein